MARGSAPSLAPDMGTWRELEQEMGSWRELKQELGPGHATVQKEAPSGLEFYLRSSSRGESQ